MKIGYNTHNLLAGHKEYSISDVSDLTQVPKPTLRYWEKEFCQFLRLRKSPGNQRRYNEQNIKILEEIKYLLNVEKYTIAGAKRRMKLMRSEQHDFKAVLKEAIKEIKGGKSINEVVDQFSKK